MQHKIVFIDDEPDLCELYEVLYELENTLNISFSNSKEALDYIEKNDVALCFIDYRMPNINGIELRKKISSEIPCVLLTGELDLKEIEGFKTVMQKPLKENEFQDLVSKILK